MTWPTGTKISSLVGCISVLPVLQLCFSQGVIPSLFSLHSLALAYPAEERFLLVLLLCSMHDREKNFVRLANLHL